MGVIINIITENQVLGFLKAQHRLKVEFIQLCGLYNSTDLPYFVTITIDHDVSKTVIPCHFNQIGDRGMILNKRHGVPPSKVGS
jgi:hypothetical protein